MERRFRSSATARAFGLVFIFLVLLGVVAFHGTVFRYVTSLVSFFYLTPAREYALLPNNILAARLLDAEQELARVSYQPLLFTALAEENERLKNLLDIAPDDVQGVGRVIARPPRTHYDTLLVSLSPSHQVHVGDSVFFEHTLLGVVHRVEGATALVSLFSSSGTSYDVRVGNPTSIVSIKGVGGGAFMMDVPTTVSITEGDVVFSAQDDTQMVAIVARVVEDSDKTTKTVYAHTPNSFADIRYVTFVRSPQQVSYDE